MYQLKLKASIIIAKPIAAVEFEPLLSEPLGTRGSNHIKDSEIYNLHNNV